LIADRHPIAKDAKLHKEGALHSESTPRRASGNRKSHPEKPNGSENHGQEPDLSGPSHSNSRKRHSDAEPNPATPGPPESRSNVLLVFERGHDHTVAGGRRRPGRQPEDRGDRPATAGNNQGKTRNQDHGLGKRGGKRQGSGTSSL
jgi:hypothetical protein